MLTEKTTGAGELLTLGVKHFVEHLPTLPCAAAPLPVCLRVAVPCSTASACRPSLPLQRSAIALQLRHGLAPACCYALLPRTRSAPAGRAAPHPRWHDSTAARPLVYEYGKSDNTERCRTGESLECEWQYPFGGLIGLFGFMGLFNLVTFWRASLGHLTSWPASVTKEAIVFNSSNWFVFNLQAKEFFFLVKKTLQAT